MITKRPCRSVEPSLTFRYRLLCSGCVQRGELWLERRENLPHFMLGSESTPSRPVLEDFGEVQHRIC
jgi:hypothetical protein